MCIRWRSTCLAASMFLASCTDSGKPRSPDGPLPPDGFDAAADAPNQSVAEPPPDTARDIARDVAAEQSPCPSGMSETDCHRCGPTLPSYCERTCPAVDCTVYPLPAECVEVCAGANCCTCDYLSTAPEFGWQVPRPSMQCGTACTDMLSRWEAYLADPAMLACTTWSDCIVVGGQPAMDPCNGHSTIGYCGKAANATTYRASPAADLETAFAATCTDHKAYDCGPGYATCTNGKCTIAGFGCCVGCNRDAAAAEMPDAPFAPNDDTRGEAGGGEAGGGEAGGGEAGGQ
jgi:hypothetical protein